MNDTVRRIVTTHDPAGKVILLRMIAYASGFPGRQGERRGSVYDRRLQPTIGAGMKEHCIAYWPRNWAASLRGKTERDIVRTERLRQLKTPGSRSNTSQGSCETESQIVATRLSRPASPGRRRGHRTERAAAGGHRHARHTMPPTLHQQRGMN